MKSSLLLVLILVPGLLASLDHLSYRIKRQDSDDDLEGSGNGENLSPTHIDEEPDSPDDGGGDPPLEPPTTPEPPQATPSPESDDVAPETAQSEPAPQTEIPAAVPTPALPLEIPEALPPIVAEETQALPQPIESVPEEPAAAEKLPDKTTKVEEEPAPPQASEPEQPAEPPLPQSPAPLDGVLEPPVVTDSSTATPDPAVSEEPNFSDPSSDFPPPPPPPVRPAAPRKASGGRIPQAPPPDDEEPEGSSSTSSEFLVDDPKDVDPSKPPINTSASNTSEALVPSIPDPIADSPSGTDEKPLGIYENENPPNASSDSTPGIDDTTFRQPIAGTGKFDASAPLESSDLKRSADWSILPVDELSLLIFILLCLILIVVLLVCCFILQHMTSWAIIKVDRSDPPGTYVNGCPLKSEDVENTAAFQNEGVAKYTVEPESKEGVVRLVSFAVEPAQQTRVSELHRSTAEVILTGDSEGQRSRPRVIAKVKDDHLTVPPNPATARPTSDPWIRDVLKRIETEDAEPEAQCSFDEVSDLRSKPDRSRYRDTAAAPSTKTFMQKYAVSSTVSSNTTKTVTESVEETSNGHLQIPPVNKAGSKKSLDDLSGDDELDDYLDNSNFPV